MIEDRQHTFLKIIGAFIMDFKLNRVGERRGIVQHVDGSDADS